MFDPSSLPVFLGVFCGLPILTANIFPIKAKKDLPRFHASLRSFYHAVFLIGMLITSRLPTNSLISFVHLYMWIDLSAAIWHPQGDHTLINYLHHGASIILTGLPLLSPAIMDQASLLAHPFLWAELSTVFLNIYHLAGHWGIDFLRQPSRLLFALTFTITRCGYLTFHWWFHCVNLSLFLFMATLLLIGMQWYWFYSLILKIIAPWSKKDISIV
jgi:hypothetical protein